MPSDSRYSEKLYGVRLLKRYYIGSKSADSKSEIKISGFFEFLCGIFTSEFYDRSKLNF